MHFSDNSIQDFQKKIVVDSSQKDHMFYVFAKGLEVISTILCDHDNNHITVIIFFSTLCSRRTNLSLEFKLHLDFPDLLSSPSSLEKKASSLIFTLCEYDAMNTVIESSMY